MWPSLEASEKLDFLEGDFSFHVSGHECATSANLLALVLAQILTFVIALALTLALGSGLWLWLALALSGPGSVRLGVCFGFRSILSFGSESCFVSIWL